MRWPLVVTDGLLWCLPRRHSAPIDGAFFAAKLEQSRRQKSGTCLKFAGVFAERFAAVFVAAKPPANFMLELCF